MTKPISRKMAVDCLLWRFSTVSRYSGDNKVMELPCSICGAALLPEQDIQFDHIHADVFDGSHDYRNLRPVHTECHKKKTKADIQANAKIKRLRNPRQSKHPMKSGGRKIPNSPWPKRKA